MADREPLLGFYEICRNKRWAGVMFTLFDSITLGTDIRYHGSSDYPIGWVPAAIYGEMNNMPNLLGSWSAVLERDPELRLQIFKAPPSVIRATQPHGLRQTQVASVEIWGDRKPDLYVLGGIKSGATKQEFDNVVNQLHTIIDRIPSR